MFKRRASSSKPQPSDTERHPVDLHTHTFYSDGRSSPLELLTGAKRKGLQTVAITDHETARASREGASLARELDLELIPATELTAAWPGYVGHGGGPDIDILAYFIDPYHELLLEHETNTRARLTARAEVVCQTLQTLGYKLHLDDVLATHADFPGFLALRDSLTRQGLVGSSAQAAKVLDTAMAETAWTSEHAAPGMAETIRFVHSLGGVAVLAHPSIVRRATDLELLNERGLAELVEMGLDGIEVFHYRLNRQQRRHFALLAKLFGLPVTGGSDEHGGPETFGRLGSEPVTQEQVEALRQAREPYAANPHT